MKLTATLFVTILFIALFRTNSYAQNKTTNPSKFFLSVGSGAGGTFSARDYDEALPFPSSGYTAFLNKKFLGTASEIAVGIHLKRNIDIKFGYNRQRFTRHAKINDTLSGSVGVLIDHDIQHVDNNWFVGMSKHYMREKGQLLWGAGLYYWTGKLHTVEVYANYVIDQEITWKGSKNGDLGAYAEIGYEYIFQPKVNLGIKSQFYWIVSGSYPGSIALIPFIKLKF